MTFIPKWAHLLRAASQEVQGIDSATFNLDASAGDSVEVNLTGSKVVWVTKDPNDQLSFQSGASYNFISSLSGVHTVEVIGQPSFAGVVSIQFTGDVPPFWRQVDASKFGGTQVGVLEIRGEAFSNNSGKIKAEITSDHLQVYWGDGISSPVRVINSDVVYKSTEDIVRDIELVSYEGFQDVTELDLIWEGGRATIDPTQQDIFDGWQNLNSLNCVSIAFESGAGNPVPCPLPNGLERLFAKGSGPFDLQDPDALRVYNSSQYSACPIRDINQYQADTIEFVHGSKWVGSSGLLQLNATSGRWANLETMLQISGTGRGIYVNYQNGVWQDLGSNTAEGATWVQNAINDVSGALFSGAPSMNFWDAHLKEVRMERGPSAPVSLHEVTKAGRPSNVPSIRVFQIGEPNGNYSFVRSFIEDVAMLKDFEELVLRKGAFLNGSWESWGTGSSREISFTYNSQSWATENALENLIVRLAQCTPVLSGSYELQDGLIVLVDGSNAPTVRNVIRDLINDMVTEATNAGKTLQITANTN